MSHALSDRSIAPGTASSAKRLVGLGAVFWVSGVAAIHLAAPLGVFSQAFALPLFIVTLPLVWLTVRLIHRLAGKVAASVEVVALVCTPALCLDGLAMTWMPSLYGAQVVDQRAAAGWLLWFVGVSLALVFWQASRQKAGIRI